MPIPLIVLAGAGLMLWRAGDIAGDAIGDAVVKAVPWVAGAAGLYIITRRR